MGSMIRCIALGAIRHRQIELYDMQALLERDGWQFVFALRFKKSTSAH